MTSAVDSTTRAAHSGEMPPFRVSLKLILLGSTAFGLLAATITAGMTFVESGSFNVFSALLGNLCYWYAWAVLAPSVLYLGGRYQFARGAWRRPLAIHVAGGFVYTIAHMSLMVLVHYLIMKSSGRQESLFYSVLRTGDWDMMIYWSLVGLRHAVDYYGEAQQRALRESHLQTSLVEARLDALRHQLQPHFLFNTLHAISTLMHKDVDAADRMLVRLSDLLRLTIDTGAVQEFALKKELELLEKYLAIEQVRFGDRLRVEIDVEPETLDARVPYLILQPLVENAIRHGIAPHVTQGRIRVLAQRDGDTLQLAVEDNGRGLTEPALAAFRQGIGLKNTRARLRHLYGNAHHLSFRQVNGDGLTVAMTIPWRPLEPEPVAEGGPA